MWSLDSVGKWNEHPNVGPAVGQDVTTWLHNRGFILETRFDSHHQSIEIYRDPMAAEFVAVMDMGGARYPILLSSLPAVLEFIRLYGEPFMRTVFSSELTAFASLARFLFLSSDGILGERVTEAQKRRRESNKLREKVCTPVC